MQIAVDRAKKQFYKNCPNNKLKHQLKLLVPCFEIVNWHATTIALARATGVSVKRDPLKKRIRLRKTTHPTYFIDGHEYFLTIQFNKDRLKSIDTIMFQDIITHELAHLLDIVARQVVNGQFSLSNNTDHDEYWQQLTKWMGGTPISEYTLTGCTNQ